MTQKEIEIKKRKRELGYQIIMLALILFADWLLWSPNELWQTLLVSSSAIAMGFVVGYHVRTVRIIASLQEENTEDISKIERNEK